MAQPSYRDIQRRINTLVAGQGLKLPDYLIDRIGEFAVPPGALLYGWKDSDENRTIQP